MTSAEIANIMFDIAIDRECFAPSEGFKIIQH